MTDKEKLTALLSDFGVEFSTDTEDGKDLILCYEGNEKVDGYSGFYTMFQFSADGHFICMGAWE